MQSPGNHDSVNHKEIGEELRPDPVTPVNGKSTEISPETKRKVTTVQEREPCISKPMANTVKTEKRKASEPADKKPNTVIKTEKGKKTREAIRARSRSMANVASNEKNTDTSQ